MSDSSARSGLAFSPHSELTACRPCQCVPVCQHTGPLSELTLTNNAFCLDTRDISGCPPSPPRRWPPASPLDHADSNGTLTLSPSSLALVPPPPAECCQIESGEGSKSLFRPRARKAKTVVCVLQVSIGASQHWILLTLNAGSGVDVPIPSFADTSNTTPSRPRRTSYMDAPDAPHADRKREM